MSFNRTIAVQNTRGLTREELDLAVHLVCSALNARFFQGIRTINEAREILDILAHEQYRRDDHDAIGESPAHTAGQLRS